MRGIVERAEGDAGVNDLREWCADGGLLRRALLSVAALFAD
jgi:hypothetical protein